MGNFHSANSGGTTTGHRASRFSFSSVDHGTNSISISNVNNGRSNKFVREHKRFGVVVVKLNSAVAPRRGSDGTVSHVVTPKGAVLYGYLYHPASMQKGKINTMKLYKLT